MDHKLKRTPGIYLTGFMGSGKSTVGESLAHQLGWDYVDLDREIHLAEQASVAEIFACRGEEEFRRLETEMLRNWMRKIERGIPAVVALGGGAFVQQRNFELLEHHGVSIWLDCPLPVIESRLQPELASRPLAHDREGFHRLYEERRTAYSRASYRIDADCAVERAVEQILALPFWK